MGAEAQRLLRDARRAVHGGGLNDGAVAALEALSLPERQDVLRALHPGMDRCAWNNGRTGHADGITLLGQMPRAERAEAATVMHQLNFKAEVLKATRAAPPESRLPGLRAFSRWSYTWRDFPQLLPWFFVCPQEVEALVPGLRSGGHAEVGEHSLGADFEACAEHHRGKAIRMLLVNEALAQPDVPLAIDRLASALHYADRAKLTQMNRYRVARAALLLPKESHALLLACIDRWKMSRHNVLPLLTMPTADIELLASPLAEVGLAPSWPVERVLPTLRLLAEVLKRGAVRAPPSAAGYVFGLPLWEAVCNLPAAEQDAMLDTLALAPAGPVAWHHPLGLERVPEAWRAIAAPLPSHIQAQIAKDTQSLQQPHEVLQVNAILETNPCALSPAKRLGMAAALYDDCRRNQQAPTPAAHARLESLVSQLRMKYVPRPYLDTVLARHETGDWVIPEAEMFAAGRRAQRLVSAGEADARLHESESTGWELPGYEYHLSCRSYSGDLLPLPGA